MNVIRLSALAPCAIALLSSAAMSETCTPAVADSQLVKPGTLTMSTNPTLPPLQFVDSNGDLKGMRIEMGEEIAKRLCLKPEYVRIEFSAMVPGLQSGRWDMINTGIFFTEERAKMMQMIPYEDQAISVSFAPSFDGTVTGIDDIVGKSIGVEVGGFEESKTRALNDELVAKGLKGIEIRTFDNFAMAFQALRAGQVDGVVSIDAVAAAYDKRGDFKQVLHGLYPAPVSVAFKSPELADAVQKTMTEMRADGTMETLFANYGIPLPDGAYVVKGPGR
ncbi:ABC transporter substrate-binding protein [Sinirhodobacter populi]|uniref:ABC transporter substrate-binding protein n=3 Tax=Paenirhodobacter populi TaxID=2306993 RepID=A0A443J545_9RHOB|nr:ABC transporter substrate-binding protein [Sinirhodobacter populi]RWR15600.1 ABC transporter substrate-binding protein [Sinirhodobacter populi]RWR21516.1 ABC transporter substrate-binding protein [Sinirhodobacter populi]RWR26158.1 ABC transporter substrate-binding protein [Sinirhodobacter populi]